jgi:hypothetical protein
MCNTDCTNLSCIGIAKFRGGEKSWYPYKANDGKINRVKTTTCQRYRSVQVGVRQNFVLHLLLGGKGAAREARGALAQIATCRA